MQPTLHMAAPSLMWAAPFLGLLFSIALFPILADRVWHRHMGLIASAWAVALLLPQAVILGPGVAAGGAWHAMLQDYLPFVTLLLALYTAGGGVLFIGGPGGTAFGNTAVLAFGMVLAGLMGTTGIAMVLIHPLLRANEFRQKRVHIVIFFIILVANAGGATSPLGDPPLYLGFLHGVPFLWPLQALVAPLLVLAYPLLVVFYLIARHLLKHEPPAPPARRLRLRGASNLGLLMVVIGSVLVQGIWHPGPVGLFGQSIGVERLLGMAVYGVVMAVSLLSTPRAVREGNLFSWGPMIEVAKLFAAIFVTIGPVLQMLSAGPAGPLAPLLRLTLDAAGRPIPAVYFWLTGGLSAFLDNAPTYLVFFQQAGGDPQQLTLETDGALRAISAGAVFFGALTYIGNAPNMMVRAIALRRGVPMPGFFTYLAWSSALLLPLFALQTLLFFRIVP